MADPLLDVSWRRGTATTPSRSTCCAIPEGGLDVRASEGSPSISQMFMHMNHERLVSVSEEAHHGQIKLGLKLSGGGGHS
jgi:hypothetical protein